MPYPHLLLLLLCGVHCTVQHKTMPLPGETHLPSLRRTVSAMDSASDSTIFSTETRKLLLSEEAAPYTIPYTLGGWRDPRVGVVNKATKTAATVGVEKTDTAGKTDTADATMYRMTQSDPLVLLVFSPVDVNPDVSLGDMLVWCNILMWCMIPCAIFTVCCKRRSAGAGAMVLSPLLAVAPLEKNTSRTKPLVEV